MTRVGFTGTQYGMTPAQKVSCEAWLREQQVSELHEAVHAPHLGAGRLGTQATVVLRSLLVLVGPVADCDATRRGDAGHHPATWHAGRAKRIGGTPLVPPAASRLSILCGRRRIVNLTRGVTTVSVHDA